MSLQTMSEKLQLAHNVLVDAYTEVRAAINESHDPDTISVRDEAWRAAQHILRTALIADNAARHIETKRRRLELESSFYSLPELDEVNIFKGGIAGIDTSEMPAIAPPTEGESEVASLVEAGTTP